jgi:hypothetical protein
MNNEYMIEMQRSRKKLFEDTSMIVAIQMPAGFSRAKIELPISACHHCTTTTSQPFSYFHFISLSIYLNLNNNKKNRLLLLAVLFSVRVRSIQFNHQSTVICFC